MKNLLIYISPTGSFDNPRPDIVANDAGVSTKIQIENSLELGWSKQDLVLFTNFKYTYAGVSATVLSDVAFFDRKPQASKINAIIALFENGTIAENETYWFHDVDAFQVCTNDELKIDLEDYDLALTDYGVAERWSTGVIYFKKNAYDIFRQIREVTYRKNIDEERALKYLTDTNPQLNKRVKKISKSYNFTPRCVKSMYDTVKPIQVFHFHPLGEAWRGGPPRAMDVFGPLLPSRLLKIFRFHRLK